MWSAGWTAPISRRPINAVKPLGQAAEAVGVGQVMVGKRRWWVLPGVDQRIFLPSGRLDD